MVHAYWTTAQNRWFNLWLYTMSILQILKTSWQCPCNIQLRPTWFLIQREEAATTYPVFLWQWTLYSHQNRLQPLCWSAISHTVYIIKLPPPSEQHRKFANHNYETIRSIIPRINSENPNHGLRCSLSALCRQHSDPWSTDTCPWYNGSSVWRFVCCGSLL